MANMINIYKLFITCMLLILKNVFCRSITKNPQGLNIVFICFEKQGRPVAGSTLMRGYMMKDALIKVGMNAEVIYTRYRSNRTANSEIISFAENYKTINACVFVKYYSNDISKTCKNLNALVFFDIIDNNYDMYLLYKIIQLSSSNTTTKYKEGKLHGLVHDAHAAIWLMQSDYLRDIAKQVGIESSTLPHQHSNINKWGLSNINNHNKLVIGILYGNYRNEPDVELFVASLCEVNAKLWLINQQIAFSKVGASSKLTSTRIEYECDSNKKIRISENIFYTNRTFSRIDVYGQNAYYTDNALVGIDIGLLIPTVFRNSSSYSIDSVDMLRPPTRFLHWISRGVPTLFYPTLAYKNIADKYKYGHTAKISLSIANIADFVSAINLLHSSSKRKKISEEGLKIASYYSTQNIANKYISIIQDFQKKQKRISFPVKQISQKPLSRSTPYSSIPHSNKRKDYLYWILVTGCSGFIGLNFVLKLTNKNIVCVETFDFYFSNAMKHQRMRYLFSHTNHFKFEYGDVYDNSNQFLFNLFKKYHIIMVIHLDTLPKIDSFCKRLINSNRLMNMMYLLHLMDVITRNNHDRNIELVYISNNDYLYRSYSTSEKNYFVKNLNQYFNESQKQKMLDTPADEVVIRYYQLEHDMKSTIFHIDIDNIYGPWKVPNIWEQMFPSSSTIILACDKHDDFNTYEDPIYVDDVASFMLYLVNKQLNNYNNHIIQNDKDKLENLVIKFTTRPISNAEFLSNLNKWLLSSSTEWKSYDVEAFNTTNKEKFNNVPNNLHINNNGMIEGSVVSLTKVMEGSKQMVRLYQNLTANKWDCSSECVKSNLCTTSDWSNALQKSKKFTENCSIVIYTIIRSSIFPKIPLNYLNSEICAIAFTITSQIYDKTYNNWKTIRVNVKNALSQETLLKLSPRSFFTSNVIYAIYIDAKYELIKPISEILKYRIASNSSSDSNKQAVIIAIRNSVMDNLETLKDTIKRSVGDKDFQISSIKKQLHYYQNFGHGFVLEYNNVIDTSILMYNMNSERGHDFRCRLHEEILDWQTFEYDYLSSSYILSVIGRIENDREPSPKREFNIIGKSKINKKFEYLRILSIRDYLVGKSNSFIKITT